MIRALFIFSATLNLRALGIRAKETTDVDPRQFDRILNEITRNTDRMTHILKQDENGN